MTRQKKLLTTVLKASFELLILLPFIIVIGVLMNNYFEMSLSLWVTSIIAGLYVGIIYRSLFRKQPWWLYILLALALGIGVSLLLTVDLRVTLLFVATLPAIIYRGMMYATRSWLDLLPVSFLWGGALVIYFFAYFLFRHVDIFTPYLDVLTVSGVTLVVITIIVTNQRRIETSTLQKEKKTLISPTIKRQNKLYLAITLFVIAVMSLPVFQKAFFSVIRAIVQFIFRGAVGEGEMVRDESPTRGSGSFLPDVEDKEPALWLKILEKIFIYGVYVVMAVAAVVALFMLFKKTRTWIKKVYHRLINFLKKITKQKDVSEETTLYIDEKESLFSWDGWKKEQQSKARNWAKNLFGKTPRWNELPDEEKVRYVYRQVIENQQDLDVEPGHTPRELLEQVKELLIADGQKNKSRKGKTRNLLPDQEQAQYEKKLDLLRVLYEDVRYGEKNIQHEKISDIRDLMDRK